MLEIIRVPNVTLDSLLSVRIQDLHHHLAHLLEELVLVLLLPGVRARVGGGLGGSWLLLGAGGDLGLGCGGGGGGGKSEVQGDVLGGSEVHRDVQGLLPGQGADVRLSPRLLLLPPDLVHSSPLLSSLLFLLFPFLKINCVGS